MRSARIGAGQATRGVLTAGLLVSVVALAGCQGDGPDQAEACAPGSSQALRGLVDDKAVLPAGNWVTVVKTDSQFRARLADMDRATRGLSDTDLSAIASAPGQGQDALKSAVAEVAKQHSGPDTASVVVGDGPMAESIAKYYQAALTHMGVRTSVRTASAADAVKAVTAGSAQVAVLGLGELGPVVKAKAPEGSDVSTQVQAIASAALKMKLALGATTSVSTTPQVMVRQDLAARLKLSTISDLTKACGDLPVTVVKGAGSASDTLTTAYGLDIAGAEAATANDALKGQASVILAPSAR